MWSTLARSGRGIYKVNTSNTASRSHRVIRSEKRYLNTEPKPNPPQQAAKPPTGTNTTPPPPKPNNPYNTATNTQIKPKKSNGFRNFLVLTTLAGGAFATAVVMSPEDSAVKQYAYKLLNIDTKSTLLSKQIKRAIDEAPHRVIEPRDSQPISVEPVHDSVQQVLREDEVTTPSEEEPVGIIEVETPRTDEHVTVPAATDSTDESRDQHVESEHVTEVVESLPEPVAPEIAEQLSDQSEASVESVPTPFSEPETPRDEPVHEPVSAAVNDSEETRVKQLTTRIGELQDKMSSLEQIKAQMDELAQRMTNETSKEAEVVKEVVKKLQLQNEEERARFARELNDQRRVLEEKYAQEIEQALQVVGQEMENNLSSLQQAYVAQHQSRIQKLQQLQSAVQQESTAREMYRQYDYESQRMHLLDIVLINLFNKIVDRKPFLQELQSLKAAAKGNEALELAVSSIPERVASEGLTSVEDLKQEFDRMSRSLRRATLLPEDKESGPLSELYATLVERLRHATNYKYDAYLDGEDGWAILSRVEYELKRQNVRTSVKELESLAKLHNKVPAELARAWLERAKQHLITLQALHILQANATAQTVHVLSNNPFNNK